MLGLLRQTNEHGLLLNQIINNTNNINRNRDIVQENNNNRLQFLPINDINLLKEFDLNLAKRDPENAELNTQFVRHV